MTIRPADLSPAARASLGLPAARRARRPAPTFHEPPPLTERQQELQAVRRRLSIVAAQLSEGGVEWAIMALEAELQALRVMATPQPPGSPQMEQLVLG